MKKDPEYLARIRDVMARLKRIEALASNPHWTADRRWKIAEEAQRSRDILDLVLEKHEEVK